VRLPVPPFGQATKSLQRIINNDAKNVKSFFDIVK